MKLLLFIQILILTLSCSYNPKQPETNNAVVLSYGDFGPQVIAYELIGMEWWQWETHGDSRPTHYDIKVVVYKDTPLATIENKFPVQPELLKDYRYVEYSAAIEYLDYHIHENIQEPLIHTLKTTKQVLNSALGV